MDARDRNDAAGDRFAESFAIEQAGVAGGKRRRIKGYANTWGVMRSGRIIHPAAVEQWLADNAEPRLPLMAQHGLVPGFASIGVVDKLKVSRAKGLYFEAALAEGTTLADEAGKLLEQGVLGNLSIGWVGTQARYISADDSDVDPWLAEKMKEAGVDRAHAFLQVELVEISLVDVADDPGAKLVANAGFVAAVEQAIAPVRQELAELRRQVQQLSAGGGSPEVAELLSGLGDQFASWIEDWKLAAIEALQTSPDVVEAAEARLQDAADALEDGLIDVAGGDDVEVGRLRQMLAGGGS